MTECNGIHDPIQLIALGTLALGYLSAKGLLEDFGDYANVSMERLKHDVGASLNLTLELSSFVNAVNN